MQLISNSLAKECEAIIGMCFVGNRIMDRIKAVLGVKFVMPITANIVHLQMSHKLLLLADYIGDYLEDRNYAECYPPTIGDYTEYSTSRECFDKLLGYFVDLEKLITDVVNKAIEEDDKMTLKILHDFLKKIKKYTAMALLFVDASEQYGCSGKDNMQFDSNIKNIIKKGY